MWTVGSARGQRCRTIPGCSRGLESSEASVGRAARLDEVSAPLETIESLISNPIQKGTNNLSYRFENAHVTRRVLHTFNLRMYRSQMVYIFLGIPPVDREGTRTHTCTLGGVGVGVVTGTRACRPYA